MSYLIMDKINRHEQKFLKIFDNKFKNLKKNFTILEFGVSEKALSTSIFLKKCKKKNDKLFSMKINNYNAVGIAEGFIECNNKKTIVKAWQYLIDTGLAFKLQGWFGRTAIDLINQGICKKKG